MLELFECSPEAKRYIKSYEGEPPEIKNEYLIKYPFYQMKIGEAFTVSIDEGKELSLRSIATYMHRKTKKRFRVIKHKKFNCIEVARVG